MVTQPGLEQRRDIKFLSKIERPVSLASAYPAATKRELQRWLLLAAFLLGFGLRGYDLGADSLWSDEAGQALAALRPTLADTLLHLQTHAAAMPLDYLVTRLVIHVSTDEFALRFPSLFWSTAAIGLLFALARQVASNKVAFVAVWLMACAPQLIYYAQEARPYAALLFFSLLSTYLLLRSLSKGDAISWGLWGVVVGIGAYFHLFVLLNAVLGGLFLFFAHLSGYYACQRRTLRLTISFILGFCGILLLVAPGYLYFAAQDSFQYPMFQFGGTIWTVTATGMGWPIHRHLVQPALLILLTTIGVAVTLVRLRNNPGLMALLIGVPCIISAIFLMNLIRGYWYIPRQLLHLQPMILIFTAIGCCEIADRVGWLIFQACRQAQRLAMGVTILMIGVTVTAGVPQLLSGYAFPRGNARILTDALLNQLETTNIIHVQPANEIVLYQFYAAIALRGDSEALIASLRPAHWEDTIQEPGAQYLLAPPAFIAENTAQLTVAGYRPLLEAPAEDGYLRSLWYRP